MKKCERVPSGDNEPSPPVWRGEGGLGPLDLLRFRADTRQELFDLLEGVGGRQCLVLDAGFRGRLDHVVLGGADGLQNCGVAFVRDLAPELGVFDAISPPPDRVVYLVRAAPGPVAMVAAHVRAAVRHGEVGAAGAAPRFHVFMVPRTTLLCTQLLEDAGALPHVHVAPYRLDAIALDADVLSLGLDACLLDVKVHGDPAPLECAAQFLARLEQLYGTPREVWTFGDAARGVVERLAHADVRAERARRRAHGTGAGAADIPRLFGAATPRYEFADEPDPYARAGVDALVVLDRAVDLVTPMVTPLTYEALIDEALGGIVDARARLPRDFVRDDDDGATAGVAPGAAPAPAACNGHVEYPLNSDDALYAELRDLNVEELGDRLGARAKAIREAYDAFRRNADASIAEIHDFVKRIPGLARIYRSLRTHVAVAERVARTTDSRAFRERWRAERALLEGQEPAYDLIEDLVAAGEPAPSLLRLLCLQSLVASRAGVEALRAFGCHFLGRGVARASCRTPHRSSGDVRVRADPAAGRRVGRRWHPLGAL